MPTVIEIAPRAHLTLTASPRHPLARFHSGRPRSNIHSFYYSGHFYLGLYGSQNVRIIYRPTALAPDGQPVRPEETGNEPFHMNLRYGRGKR